MYLTRCEMADMMPDGRQLMSDEPEEMESSRHYQQLALLVSSLEWHWRERDDFFIGANLTVYYAHQQLQRREFRGPDFFLVRDTTREARTSWVVWEEGGRYPDLIIELLSDATAKVDRTDKKSLYQNIFRTPEYFWFSPATLELAGFSLVDGRYEPIPPDARGWYWSGILELWLGVQDGLLRYFEVDGTRVPTPSEAAEQEMAQLARERARAERERERAEQERERAEQERGRAEQEQRRAERERERAVRLEQRLRALGIDPDEATLDEEGTRHT